jgi:hypothetical protein
MEIDMKHTPGPWSALPEKLLDGRHIGGRSPQVVRNGQSIAKVMRSLDARIKDGASAEAEANARLIAAAPELFEALMYIVNDAEPGEDARLTTAGYNLACAAIAKASGEF